MYMTLALLHHILFTMVASYLHEGMKTLVSPLIAPELNSGACTWNAESPRFWQ